MPIISKIGAKSRKVRLVYALIFTGLIVGAVSMIYPFLLMLAGSTHSEADVNEASAYPQYWFDDASLYRKFVESKYDVIIGTVEAQFWEPIGSWQKIEKPPDVDPDLLAAFLAWRPQCPWWRLGQTRGGRMLPLNGRLFRNELSARFHGDIDALCRELDVPLKTWGDVIPPSIDASRYSGNNQPYLVAYRDFAATRPIDERIIPNLDGLFWQSYLVPKYGDQIGPYNTAHSTHYANYQEIFLTPHVPAAELAREDWEKFVRGQLKLEFIRLNPALAEPFHHFLQSVAYADVGELNHKYGTHYAHFDEVPFSTTAPPDPMGQVDWERFLKDPAACPVEQIEVYGPRQAFEEFVARERHMPANHMPPLPLPIAQADWHDMIARAGAVRMEFTTRNYKNVFGYVALHGHGILNTVIYCLLAIGTSLLVNPLAAYALSRYRPPSTYTVLLFCMATMAFPTEVTMIPAFLLLKRFPLGPLICGIGVMALALWALGRWRPRWPEGMRLTVALACAILAGAWGLPALVGDTHVSLLNTFAALVLPGMANGFSIFLLKGFFDSLPQELYEAAEIDGAGEWTKFWMITMSLSKPILAVIALAAFTGAYSAFMMALVIIPDQKMWTLMVWLFQLQSTSHQSVVYASLVIAAIPTFLVFAFCQNLIMRGIVVPVEK